MCRAYEQQKVREASAKTYLVLQSRGCFGVLIVLMHRFSNATFFGFFSVCLMLPLQV